MNNKYSLKKYLTPLLTTEPLSGEWKTISQEEIDKFAFATGDFQWLHTDAARCAKESPFGGPVAHGMLTLGKIVGSFFEIFDTSEYRSIVNYGCEKVRFPSPLLVGQRYRVRILGLEAKNEKHHCDFVFKAEVEKESSEKPACVAIVVFRLID